MESSTLTKALTKCPRCHGTGEVKTWADVPTRDCSDCYGTGLAGMTIARLELEAVCPLHGAGCPAWVRPTAADYRAEAAAL